jgi:hypothetical protein
MTGMQAGPNPRRRVRWKAFAKYGLAFTGVLMLLWAIWNPQNRVQWVLTGVLVLATWGVWLGLDHEDTDKHPQPPPPQPPGGTLRGNPVTVHREERRHRRDQRQP